jgi:hypothetical protein
VKDAKFKKMKYTKKMLKHLTQPENVKDDSEWGENVQKIRKRVIYMKYNQLFQNFSQGLDPSPSFCQTPAFEPNPLL